MLKYYSYLLHTFLVIICLFYLIKLIQKHLNKKNYGTIIILNGPSCSGKSSIQKELQKKFEQPYLKIGIDNFFVGLLPEKFILEKKDIMYGTFSKENDDKQVYKLTITKEGNNIISGMLKAIAAYASEGNNIIVDYIAYEKQWINNLKKILKDFTVYFIGIPLDELEKREVSRKTSPIGHTRSHHKSVHEGCNYDLEITTQNNSPEQSAKLIYDFIRQNSAHNI